MSFVCNVKLQQSEWWNLLRNSAWLMQNFRRIPRRLQAYSFVSYILFFPTSKFFLIFFLAQTSQTLARSLDRYTFLFWRVTCRRTIFSLSIWKKNVLSRLAPAPPPPPPHSPSCPPTLCCSPPPSRDMKQWRLASQLRATTTEKIGSNWRDQTGGFYFGKHRFPSDLWCNSKIGSIWPLRMWIAAANLTEFFPALVFE
jgi:hypothetical protein